MKAIALFVASVLSVHGAHAADPTVRVVVKDVNLHGLVINAGHLLRQDVVIANLQTTRVSLDEAFDSAESLYADLAERSGARAFRLDKVHVIRPACVPGIAPLDPLNAGPGRAATVGFTQVPVKTLYELIATEGGMTVGGWPPKPPLQVVGIRMKDRSWYDIYRVTHQATGAVFSRMGTTALFRGLELPVCVPPAAAEAPTEEVPADCPAPLTRRTKASDDGGERCDILERHHLEKLTVRGFIAVGDDRSVLLEGVDRLTYLVDKGHYIGRNLGKIISIDDNGLVVREVQKDAAGLPLFAFIRIDYDNRRTVVKREYL